MDPTVRAQLMTYSRSLPVAEVLLRAREMSFDAVAMRATTAIKPTSDTTTSKVMTATALTLLPATSAVLVRAEAKSSSALMPCGLVSAVGVCHHDPARMKVKRNVSSAVVAASLVACGHGLFVDRADSSAGAVGPVSVGWDIGLSPVLGVQFEVGPGMGLAGSGLLAF